MSASRVDRTLISACDASVNGSTRISTPIHEQISISDHFPRITCPAGSCVELIARRPLTRPNVSSSSVFSQRNDGYPATFGACCHLSRTVGSTAHPKLPSFVMSPCSSASSKLKTFPQLAAPPNVTFADRDAYVYDPGEFAG